MPTIIKFPFLVKNKIQFDRLMKFLGEHNIKWRDGTNATGFNLKSEGVRFPMVILYSNSRKYLTCVQTDDVRRVHCIQKEENIEFD